jgi:hypothetical protein
MRSKFNLILLWKDQVELANRSTNIQGKVLSSENINLLLFKKIEKIVS